MDDIIHHPVSLVGSISTNLHACSIETYRKSHTSSSSSSSVDSPVFFLCGTYQLNEGNFNVIEENDTTAPTVVQQSHVGELLFIQFDLLTGDSTVLHSISFSSAGILDMKVVSDHLVIALSSGYLEVHRIESLEAGCVHVPMVGRIGDESEGFYLSVDVDLRLSLDRCWKENNTLIAVSTQMGSIMVYRYTAGAGTKDVDHSLSLVHRICRAHTLFDEVMPVWICAFDAHAYNDSKSCSIHLLSGGDDCLLKLWELSPSSEEVEEEEEDCSRCVSSYRLQSSSKTAMAGVTSAEWHPTIRDLFATGSYDECVRVWDHRSICSGPLLELSTGGGIWRCKWHVMSSDDHATTRSFLVLACMHQGCLVVELDIITTSSSRLHHTGDHSLLSYSVNVKARYHHNTSYPGSIIEGSNAHLLYGIAVIHCAVVDSSNDDDGGTHSADETAVDSCNSSSNNSDSASSNLVLASCYFYDNLIEVLRVKLLLL